MSIGGCSKCGGAHFSGLHPLMPDAFDKSCKCASTCTCGGYIDDLGQFLGWRFFMACRCPLKAQRIAERRADDEKERQKKINRGYLLNTGPSYAPAYGASNYLAWEK